MKKLIVLGLILISQIADAEVRFFRLVGAPGTTITSVSPDGTVQWSNAQTNVPCTIQTTTNWSGGWVDCVQVTVTNTKMCVQALAAIPAPTVPAGMALIPAGSFSMGDPFNEFDGEAAHPVHAVNLSAFYMDTHEVSKALWDEVYNWALTNGYNFNNAGAGKGPNHPVHAVSWYDMVKWCNARSEKEGLVPAYYTSAAQTTVYRTGSVSVENEWVKWTAGYRLPTEAEWEKSARGGLVGKRFPWGDTITHAQANYFSTITYLCDISLTRGYNPVGNDGISPFTSPVGSFAPNGYGLYDMAGNVWERVWDCYDSSWYGKAGATQNDTRGPSGPTGLRAIRGGGWFNIQLYSQCANRYYYFPFNALDSVGFRTVKGL